MNPATIALIAEIMVKYGIPAAERLVQMFQKPAVTQSDWDDLFGKARENANKFLEATKTIDGGT